MKIGDLGNMGNLGNLDKVPTEYPLALQTGAEYVMRVHFFGPSLKRTPWWVKRARLKFTHCAIQLGPYMLEIPAGGRCDLYDARQLLQDRIETEPRDWYCLQITRSDLDIEMLLEGIEWLIGKKCQRLITVLRYLHLWPREAINCVTPVKVILYVFGFQVRGEIPDDILTDITAGLAAYRAAPDPAARQLD